MRVCACLRTCLCTSCVCARPPACMHTHTRMPARLHACAYACMHDARMHARVQACCACLRACVPLCLSAKVLPSIHADDSEKLACLHTGGMAAGVSESDVMDWSYSINYASNFNFTVHDAALCLNVGVLNMTYPHAAIQPETTTAI